MRIFSGHSEFIQPLGAFTFENPQFSGQMVQEGNFDNFSINC